MIKKIFKAIKNILFPKIYMPWEDPINGSNLTHNERVEMINIHTANLRPTKSLGVRETESMAVGD